MGDSTVRCEKRVLRLAVDGPPGRFDIVTGVNSVNVPECYNGPRTRHEIDVTFSLVAATGRVRHEFQGVHPLEEFGKRCRRPSSRSTSTA